MTIERFRFLLADGTSVYGVTASGALLWWHAWTDNSPAPSVAEGSQIGVGWSDLAQLVPAGDGILYAVTPTGELLWYQDLQRDGSNAADGSTGWAEASGSQIGSGWNMFTHLFSGGGGVLYAITPTGELLWYQDLQRDGSNAADGSTGWAEASGSQIGSGWSGFRHVVPGGDGVIYAVTAKGDLLWYRDDVQDGSNGPSGETGWAAASGSKVGRGWDFLLHLFAGGDGELYACAALEQGPGIRRYRDQLRDGSNGPSGAGWVMNPDVQQGWQVAAIEGYCWPPSVVTGETIRFHTSSATPGEATASIVRLGGRGPRMGAPVAPVRSFDCDFQAAGSYGTDCGWPESFAVDVPANAPAWGPGFYAARVQGPQGSTYDIPFIVRRESTRAELALLVNVNTWNAYNAWGGASNYTGTENPILLTMKRPNHHLLSSSLDHPLGNHMLRSEVWLYSWLRGQGYQLDLYTDLDLEVPPADFASYKALIISTHPEYWTKTTMANVTAYLDAGGSVLYLGGNAMYRPTSAQAEQPGGALDRIAARPDLWPSYPSYEGKPLLAAHPENFFYDGEIVQMGLAVTDPDHRFMPGGLTAGQVVGLTGWNGDPAAPRWWGASGWETDPWHGPLPPDVAGLARDTPDRGTVLACYDTAAGGFVLGAGSVTFVGSLMEDLVLQQVVNNALAEALTKP